MQTALIRMIISQAVALPIQVLRRSIEYSKFWTLMGRDRSAKKVVSTYYMAPPGPWAGRCRARSVPASDLLGRGVGAEIMVVRHAAADYSILLPLRRASRKRDLRLQDLLEQRVLSRLLLHHLVVDLELLLEDGVGRLVEFDVVLGLQLDIVLGIAVNRLPRHVGGGRVHGVGDDRLHLFRQRVVLVLVEGDLELLGVLVIALQHADLRDIGEAEYAVGSGIVEFGCIEQASVHGGNDFAAGQRVHRRALRRIHV